MKDYADKVVWIIGASSGIGYALAQELSMRGASLILSARSEDKLMALNAVLGGHHRIMAFDVSRAEDFAKAFLSIGKLDSAIYLASDYTPGNIIDITPENAAKTLAVNLEGAFTFLRLVLPHYKLQGYGQIALCGSVAGYIGLPGGQPYSATKAAIVNLAQSLRVEVADHGIDVRLISPGFVKTPMTDKNDFSMPMQIEPEEAARAIADGLLGNKFEIHFPKRFTYLMKILGLLPYKIYFLIARRIKR